VSILN